jgi:hypothetical protein
MPIDRPQQTIARRRRALAAPLSIGGHVLAVMALVWTPLQQPPPPDTAQMTASLVDGAILTSAPKPPAPAKPAPPKPTPPKTNVRRAARPRPVDPLPADETPTKAAVAELSEAQLIGAATAASDSGPPGSGSGPKGQHCNMAQLLQSALRRDRLVQSAAAEAHRGKAMIVWNGDWVRSSSEDGKGLAAVREAIMWEVGFAPATCRSQPMHGLVLLSLNDAPGSPRLVVGSGQWRWSDLLH